MNKKLINPPTVFNSMQYGFSQAVEAIGSRHLFLSGQVGVDKDEAMVAGGIQEQAYAAIDNMERILLAAGACLDNVVMLRLYIKSGADSPEDQRKIAEVLSNKFGNTPPASSWVIVSGLSLPEWLIEIEAQALLP